MTIFAAAAVLLAVALAVGAVVDTRDRRAGRRARRLTHRGLRADVRNRRRELRAARAALSSHAGRRGR